MLTVSKSACRTCIPSVAGPLFNNEGVLLHVGATIIWSDGRRANFQCGFDQALTQYLEVTLLPFPTSGCAMRLPAHPVLSSCLYQFDNCRSLLIIALRPSCCMSIVTPSSVGMLSEQCLPLYAALRLLCTCSCHMLLCVARPTVLKTEAGLGCSLLRWSSQELIARLQGPHVCLAV